MKELITKYKFKIADMQRLKLYYEKREIDRHYLSLLSGEIQAYSNVIFDLEQIINKENETNNIKFK